MSRLYQIFAGLAVGQLIILFWVYPVGPMTWDSGTYHLAAKTFIETGGFYIQNGLDIFHSGLMRIGQVVMPTGQLVSHYPALYTILSAPFYAVFGFKGFALLNSLSFLLTLLITWHMTTWFTVRRHAPLLAVLLYGLCSFAWDYSVSSYPHLFSSLLIMGSVYLAWGVFLQRQNHQIFQTYPLICLFLSGFLFGLSVGVRIDSLFAGLALAVPCLRGKGIAWRPALSLALGFAGPVLLLAWINQIKFGSFNPFTYGRQGADDFTGGLVLYIPILVILSAVCLVYAYRDILLARVRRQHILLAIGFLALVVAALPIGDLMPKASQSEARVWSNFYQILIDLRIRPEISEPGLTRSENGAVIYMDGVKKSLLQSMPILVILVFAGFLDLWRRRLAHRYLLYLIPIGYIAVFGTITGDGSVALNMRYLTPILPFISIILAINLLWLGFRLPTSRVRVGMIFVIWAWTVIAFMNIRKSIELQELLFLSIPLVLALLMLGLRIAVQLRPRIRIIRQLLCRLVLLAMIYGSAMVFGSDVFSSSILRLGLRLASEAYLPQIKPNSLVITQSPDVIWPIMDRGDKTYIATILFGSCQELRQLIGTHIDKRPVYLLLNLEEFKKSPGRSCVPDLLLDGRKITYHRPENWQDLTAGWIHQLRVEK